MRAILHMDMDAFYASVEIRDRPELAGKPVIIGALPGCRGVVSTASYEARKYGIHSAMPISQAVKRCPQGVFLPPDIRKYSENSNRIMKILRDFTPLMEIISIDEAFLDVTGCQRLFGSPLIIARAIKDRILAKERLTCSIGIAPNKFLAKIASDLEKPDGLTLVSKEKAREFLAPLHIGRMWGIGQKTEARLLGNGIRTFNDLLNHPEKSLRAILGDQIGHYKALARGEDDREVVPVEKAKSISNETTFEKDVNTAHDVIHTLKLLSARVGRRMRKSENHPKTVTLKIRFQDFSTFTRRKTFQRALYTDDEIITAATGLLAGFKLHQPVRLVGVAVSNFETARQLSLFSKSAEKNESMTHTVDEIKDRFGDGIIKPLSHLKDF